MNEESALFVADDLKQLVEVQREIRQNRSRGERPGAIVEFLRLPRLVDRHVLEFGIDHPDQLRA